METKSPKFLFEALLISARKNRASDIHIINGLPPALRVAGEVLMATNWKPFDAPAIEDIAALILKSGQRERLERERELCVSHYNPQFGRLRVTFYHRLDAIEVAIRLCQETILTGAELNLPPVVDDLATRTSGLVLVTGPTGAGKTTTLNYIVDLVNGSRRGKIVTIEDPVEFEHHHRRGIVTQIEVGTDTLSFASCLRSVLRLDPDVIVIGEMRDFETISTALIGAETGHLVLATLHTPSAVGTAERIINVFPGEQQAQAATQFSATLLAVLSQRLVPTVDKKSRALATEVLIANDAVRTQLREREFHQLVNTIWTGQSAGMHTMEMSLVDLYRNGVITRASAYAYANRIPSLESLLRSREDKDEMDE